MPSLAGVMEAEDEAPAIAVPHPAAAPRRSSTTRIRASLLRHHLPSRRSRTAWTISIALHLAMGLWIAHAVHAMIADAQTPVDPGITIRWLPATPLPEVPTDDPPAQQVTVTVIADTDPASPVLPAIDVPVPPPADPGYVTAFLDQQTTTSVDPRRSSVHHQLRQPLRMAPSMPTSSLGGSVEMGNALQDGMPVALPASPAEAEPFVIDGPKPEYPAISLREGHQGKVLLAVMLDSEGRVVEAQVQASSGHRSLDAAAIKAVRRWRFNAGGDGRHATVRLVFLTI